MLQSRYGFKFLSHLEPEQRLKFEHLAREKSVRKGEQIIGHGRDNSTDVFFVIEGRFKVVIYSPSGEEVPFRIIGPGDHFGEIAALDLGQRSASVVTQTNGRLAFMSGKEFKSILEGSPKASLWLAGQLAAQIRTLTERIFEFSALNVRNRIRSELLRMAWQLPVRDNRAEIKAMPTQGELAGLLGTHREAVSREFADLKKRGLIARVGRLWVVLDVEKLSLLLRRASGEESTEGPVRGKASAHKRRKR